MTTYTKVILSGSTNGKGIKIAQTATAGTLLHTAVAGTTDLDEIYISLINNHTIPVEVTIEWGEATVPDGTIKQTIPAKSGLYPIIKGMLLQNGLEVRAFAAVANVVIAHGYANRIVSV
jgi:hypothetical protein